MGPGRERGVPPVARGHRLRALRRRRGAPRAAARLEPHPRDRGVRPHDPRDVLHPVGRARERPRVQLLDARAGPARVLRLVVVVGLGLLAWRGDRLRSPVSIDEPLSREGAFVANNVLFVGFAVVVLLGTVFPLAYQALQPSRPVTVGPPYFDTVAVPVALCVLFLMAIAPVLGWRHVDGGARLAAAPRPRVGRDRARRRRSSPSACAGLGTLLAYLLAVVAAGTALRTLLGNLRAARQRRDPWWHGLVGRSSGGMVVHLGVVLATVGIVSSVSFATRAEVTLRPPGQTARVGGHTVQYVVLQRGQEPGAHRGAGRHPRRRRRPVLSGGHHVRRDCATAGSARPPSTRAG